MTELRYNKGRLFLLLIGAIVLSALCSWLAITHPAPTGHGRYAALYDLVGPTGVTLLIGAGALFFAGCGVIAAVHLASDGVAARITGQGLELNDIWGRRHVAWRELRGFDTRTVQVRRRDLHWLVIHHAPFRAGPFTRTKTNLQHGHVRGDTDAVVAWTQAAALAAAQASAPPEAPAAQPRGFGRRTALGAPAS